GDVDFLVARQGEQKVEWPLKAIDRYQKRVVRRRRRIEGIERFGDLAHAVTLRSSARRAFAAAGSKASGTVRCDSACCARLSAIPSSVLASSATSRISSIFPLQ